MQVLNGTSTSTNTSRIDNLLRYLTQSQHPVQDTGRAKHRSPDLQHIQSIVNDLKGFDFFDLDDTTESAKAENSDIEDLPPFDDEVVKRLSRNVFDDFKGKFEEMISGSKKTDKTKASKFASKKKRKLNRLFTDIVLPENVKQIESPKQEEAEVLPALVAEQSESDKSITDWNYFQSKLSPEQQVEISNFLDHVEDKPQAFKFDTSPYLLAQMEKLNHPGQEESAPEDETLSGAKKFFDFENAPAKRSLYDNQIEDYQKIAKLKSKLIAEYRDHHPVVDYSAILRKIDADTQRRAEKSDDFLDGFYRLNDGSSRIQDVYKPYHSDTLVMSPFELNLNFQLDKEFKELDFDHEVPDQPQQDSLDAEVPLHKPENDENEEADDDSP